jgi:hypothetical protein
MINATYWSIFARAMALCVVLIVVAGPGVSEPLMLDPHDPDVRQWVTALNKGDYATALKLLRPFAEQDDFRAEIYLGTLYYDGNGVPKSAVEAVTWWRKAAEQGSPEAQADLGYCYEEGVGVLRDLVRAHMWFNLAAAAGEKRGADERDKLEKRMTAAQITEAEKLAREWKPTIRPGDAELRSQARARDVAACQHHNSGWEEMPTFGVVDFIGEFTKHCAELGVKINCKGVRRDLPTPPGKTKDDLDRIRDHYNWVQECYDQ